MSTVLFLHVSISTVETISNFPFLPLFWLMIPHLGRYVHDNNDAIVEQKDPSTADYLIIDDVTSKNNRRRGLAVRDSDITVKDSIFAYNGEDGIRIEGDKNNPTKVTFEGTVSSYQNGRNGILVGVSGPGNGPFDAEVTVKGTLNTYLNEQDGLFVGSPVDMDPFTVADGASFNACENDGIDIQNKAPAGEVNFMNSGAFTCGSTAGNGKDDIPTCAPCPACS